MRLSPFLLAISAVAACSLSPDVAGSADVLCQVFQGSGQPFAKHGRHRLQGRDDEDSSDRYCGLVRSQFECAGGGTDPLHLCGSRLGDGQDSCGHSNRIGPVGQLHALQYINLREAAP